MAIITVLISDKELNGVAGGLSVEISAPIICFEAQASLAAARFEQLK